MVHLALRLAYGLALIAILFIPFGSYHSFGEPAIYGVLWGYHLPIGYVALVLGVLVIFSPKTILARNYSFGATMVVIGLFLMLSLLLYPKQISINLIHGTNVNADIDYPVGNSVTLFLALFSIIVGLTARIGIFIQRQIKQKSVLRNRIKYDRSNNIAVGSHV